MQRPTAAWLRQQLPDWIASYERALEFFGVCTELWVPDGLRSGVSNTALGHSLERASGAAD